MAFAVIIGGIGTIEGPILGTIVYMVLQQELQSYNAWYLIILGVVAIAIALFARRGLWGTVDDRFNIRLFPVGYHLWAPGERRGRTARHAAAPRRTSRTSYAVTSPCGPESVLAESRPGCYRRGALPPSCDAVAAGRAGAGGAGGHNGGVLLQRLLRFPGRSPLPRRGWPRLPRIAAALRDRRARRGAGRGGVPVR